MRRLAKACLSGAATAGLLLSQLMPVGCAGPQAHCRVTPQPMSDAGPDIRPYFHDPAGEHSPGRDALVRLLQKRIKYVFVIFNENHSFDNEFGTFPGVNGLYSDGRRPRSAADTPGFTQTYTDLVNGKTVTVQPFLIGPGQNSTVVDSVDHSHRGLATKIDTVNGTPRMDRFAYDEYTRFAREGGTANNAKGTQYARLVMSYIDCDTIPFFWKWASRLHDLRQYLCDGGHALDPKRDRHDRRPVG